MIAMPKKKKTINGWDVAYLGINNNNNNNNSNNNNNDHGVSQFGGFDWGTAGNDEQFGGFGKSMNDNNNNNSKGFDCGTAEWDTATAEWGTATADMNNNSKNDNNNNDTDGTKNPIIETIDSNQLHRVKITTGDIEEDDNEDDNINTTQIGTGFIILLQIIILLPMLKVHLIGILA